MAHDGGGKRIPEWKRGKFRARSSGGRSFVMLRHDLIRLPQFQNLSGNAIKLLLFLVSQYNGKNNGNFSMAKSDLLKSGWRSEATALKARAELLASQFIAITRHGHNRRCYLFAVTWLAIDDCPGKGLELPSERNPSDAWKTGSAPQKLEGCPPDNGV